MCFSFLSFFFFSMSWLVYFEQGVGIFSFHLAVCLSHPATWTRGNIFQFKVGKNNGAAKFHPWEKVRYSFKNVRKAAGFALRYQGENWYLCTGSFINTWKNTENTWEDVQKSAATWREYQLFFTRDLGHFGYSLCIFTWSFVAGTGWCFWFSKTHFSSSLPLIRSTDITKKSYFSPV